MAARGRMVGMEVIYVNLFQRTLLGVLATALVAALVLLARLESSEPAAAAPPAPDGQAESIVVVGEAKVSARPDVAYVSGGVQAQAPSASQAQALLNERMSKLFARAAQLGIPERDTRHGGYSVSLQHCCGGGYQASQQITLVVRDVGQLTTVVDAIVQSDLVTNVYVRLAVERVEAPEAQARELAIRDAGEKAQVSARAAGLKLGRVATVADLGVAGYGAGGFGASGGGGVATAAYSPTKVPMGEFEIVVRVRVGFTVDRAGSP